jgi:hypothetical protein
VVLSKSNIVDSNKNPGKAIRNRLDVLLVVSDVLHAAKFHAQTHSGIAAGLGTYIEGLVELVASCLRDKGTSFEKKLKALIMFWRTNELLPAKNVDSIIVATRKALSLAQSDAPPTTEKTKPALPEWFGDRSASWDNLPASYLLRSMITNPARPINPRTIRIKNFGKQEPSERICGLLEEYFNNVGLAYRPSGDLVVDEPAQDTLWLDPVGNLVRQAKTTNEVTSISNAYGWTIKTCKSIKEHGVPENIHKARNEYQSGRAFVDELDIEGIDRRDRRGYAGDRSRSPKRRRYSSVSDHDRHSRHRSYDSRSSSRSSYNDRDDRPSSRDDRPSSRDKRRERPRTSKFDDKEYDKRGRDRDREFDQRRPPPNSYSRGLAQPNAQAPSRWSGNSSSNQDNYSDPSMSNIYNAPPLPNGGFNQVQGPPPPPPFDPAFFNLPQPPPLGQFPMPSISPSYPGAPGGPVAGVSVPPPPPNFSQPFYNNLPQMGGYFNNGYNSFGNGSGQNFGGNNQGYGGFNRGGFQSGGYNGRGRFQGSNQRGRGGGGNRWN